MQQQMSMSSYQRNLFETRYKAPRSQESGWLDVFARVASCLALKLAPYGLPDLRESYFELMAGGLFIAGSPQLWNFGTERRFADCGSSCYTGYMGDSLEEFREADSHAEAVYVASGGFGLHLDSVRPRGTYIRHCSEGAMGSMCDGGPALRVEGTTGYITGSGRARGALMLQLSVGHPDAVEFMLKKNVQALGWMDDWPANAEAVVRTVLPDETGAVRSARVHRLMPLIFEFSSRYSTARRWPTIAEASSEMWSFDRLDEAVGAGILAIRDDRIVPMVTDWAKEEGAPGRHRPANLDWSLPRQNCNMSVRFPDEFMRAVEADLPWTFSWFSPEECGPGQEPVTKTDMPWEGQYGLRETNYNLHVDKDTSELSFVVDYPARKYGVVITTWEGLLENLRPNQNQWRDSDYARSFHRHLEPTISRYSGRIMARQVWEMFVEASHDHADPAAVFSGTYEMFNPTDPAVYGERLSNPCAEYVNPPGGSCNLGSVNLRECCDRVGPVAYPEADSRRAMESAADWALVRDSQAFRALLALVQTVSRSATDYLTATLQHNRAPVEFIEQMTREHFRTVGLGIMGLAEAMMHFHVRYGSVCSEHLTAAIMSEIALSAWERSFELAMGHGMPKPLAWNQGRMSRIFTLRAYNCDAYGLTADHSARWYSLIKRVDAGEYGTHTCVTSVAPTGTISMIAGWVTGGKTVTSGVEPVYSWVVLRKDNSGKEIVENDLRLSPEHSGMPWMVTAMDGISPMDHVRVQAGACAFCCMSVSKTVNMPSTATVEELSELYFEAWRRRIPSTAPYVDGSKPMQVLTALECPSGECRVDYSALLSEGQQATAK